MVAAGKGKSKVKSYAPCGCAGLFLGRASRGEQPEATGVAGSGATGRRGEKSPPRAG